MTDDKTAIRLVCPKFNGHKGKEFTAWKRQYASSRLSKKLILTLFVSKIK